jgi:DNA-binding beta-propeller fold protein YncE
MRVLPPIRLALSAAALLVGVAAAAPAGATAADTAYWGNNNVGGISFANLDGTGGGGQLDTTGATPTNPAGIAIDAAAGRIYWASGFNSTINFAELDGTGGGGQISTAGTGANNIRGLTIDPAAGRSYWANSGDHSLSFADLDDTGGARFNTAGATPQTPHGVAIDSVGGRLYWANGNDTISFANLDGTGGGGQLDTSGAPVSSPQGLAIDNFTSRIYWANEGDDMGPGDPSIGFANLSGGSGGQLNTTGAPLSGPGGVAIDSAAGRIYWTNDQPSAISFANLDGSGSGGQLNTSGATVNGPTFIALLRSPSGVAAPQVTGGSTAGSTLECSPGGWAPDLLGAFLYRVPTDFEYQWTLGGSDIAGATSDTLGPVGPGSYACRVTATNQAGADSEVSNPFVVAPAPVVTQPSSAEAKRKLCKSLRRKLSFSKRRLDAAVHEFSRERLRQRITKLRQMINARGCT